MHGDFCDYRIIALYLKMRRFPRLRVWEYLRGGIRRMLRSLLIMRSSACLALGLLVSMTAAQVTNAQSPQAGYRAPNAAPYAQYGMSRPPASPLAGGSPAAHGDAYMDVHGNNIVMPASYCNGCQSGGYGGGGSTCPGAGYCQDNMAVDFGSCGLPDQCGPH
jgi:hypothetical protein